MPRTRAATEPDAPTDDELTAAGLKAEGVPETEDVVHMASLNKNGEADQSAGFKFLEPAVGNALLDLQKESQQTGTDQVREQGPDKIREAKKDKA